MLGNESNSKKLLVTKNKLSTNDANVSTNNNMKRYKSHEVYMAGSKKKTETKQIKETLQSPVASSMNLNFENKVTDVKNVRTLNLQTYSKFNFNKSKDLGSNQKSNSKTPSQSGKKQNLSPDSGKIASKMTSYITNKPKPAQKAPVVSKIMNDESIQELDTEENINSLDEHDEREMDEMKSSELLTDFYTNDIGEVSVIADKEKKLINNIPQTFVKPFKTKFVNINLNPEKENEQVHEIEKKSIPIRPTEKKSSKKQRKGSAKDVPTILKENLSPKIEINEIDKDLQIPQIDLNENQTNLDASQRKLLISAKKGDRDTFLECIETILNNAKGDINFKDESGWTALHHACDEGNLKIVDILINTNADLNCRTNNKKSPLHLATSHGYFDISKNLIENGSIINSLDDEKNTPIHICATIGHLELLKYLLDRFPQADTKNIYGKTPINLAKKDDVKALLQEYLKKNESQYHKVHIHTANNKSANSLFKNLKSGTKHNNYTNETNIKEANINSNNQSLKTPNKNITNITSTTGNNANLGNPYNKNQNEKSSHNKFQSNDFNTKPYSQNNNIEIQINTNINHPGGGNINVVNVNNTPNTKKININDKVQVTVETKLNNNNNQITTNLNPTKPTIVNRGLTHTSTSVKFNTQTTNNYTTNRSHAKFTGVSSKLKKPLTANAGNTTVNTNTSRNMNVKKQEDNNIIDNNIKKEEISPIKKNTSRGESNSKILNLNNIPIIDISDNRQLIDDLEEILPNKFEDDLNNHSRNNLNISNGANNKSNSNSDDKDSCHLNSCSLEEESIGPSSFECHALLGKGSFGEVYLVEKRNTKTFYAMKVLSKDKIMGQNLVKYAMTERNVLSITNHPFIVKLNFSFQTSDKLFLILDYCPGGDLAEHLARENRFSEHIAKIYLCEIILALEDLHKRDIIFRDLKPDNVVLDSQGHAQLTDFGLSKEGVLDSKSAKSFCGSIAYLAPEMLKRTGHGKAVDWYLLGVLFYEMLVGIPPYFTNNKEQLFKNIEKAELQIPKFVSEDAASLLRALLQRDPLQRLGSGKNDAYEIKQHKYFNDVNWESVYGRKLKPPIPLFKNRAIQQFNKPKVFEETNSHGIFFLNSQFDNHFDGWSFIKTDEQPTTNNTKMK